MRVFYSLRTGGVLLAASLLFGVLGQLSAQTVYVAGKEEISVLKAVDGKWQRCEAHPEERTMYLTVSPDGKTLACALNDSAVKFYSISPDGKLSPGKRCPSGGKTCCHLSFSPSGKTLYAANYTGGNICALEGLERLHLIPTQEDEQSQVKPHPHYASLAPDGRQLAVCDLGLDRIFLYAVKDEIPQQAGRVEITLPPKAGPRHLLFSADGSLIYSANEVNSTVTVFRRVDGSWKETQTLPTTDRKTEKRNYPGAIRYSEDGKFLFVTNRGGADTVAVFAIRKDGLLEKHQEFSTAAYPSDILQFDGKLVIACLKGNRVEIREFDASTGKASDCRQSLELPGAIGLALGHLEKQ